jgi:streptomycin 6-kinase
MHPIPRGLMWWASEPGGAAWLERLPLLIARCADRWRLQIQAPIEPASVSYVAPVLQEDGSKAILKINFPERESEREADALSLWGGEVSARLLAYDEPIRALLLEWIEPGERLWQSSEEESLLITVGLLRRLHREPPLNHSFLLLRDEARRWAQELPLHFAALGRPFEPRLIEEAAALAAYFAKEPSARQVVLHQDLHGGNILRGTREPWLIIDPKPLVGDASFDIASVLRDRRPRLEEDPDPQKTIQSRFDFLVDGLQVERDRARGWALIHSLAWGMTETTYSLPMISCARWIAALDG